ncbi:MAG: flagellar protein export ATPase FliI [Candidatus Gastranaerophilales bacterium]|nr:flagellar protein export ATPase FliI [Candidatus Gastranaerophilales bacterium]MCM1072984.1 flagellar protein export ATPase FliI [Bacteroides sp.]
MMSWNKDVYSDIIKKTKTIKEVGKITEIIGLTIESDGPKSSIGDLCYIYNDYNDSPMMAEVVGFKKDKILLMPLASPDGIRPGAHVVNSGSAMKIGVGNQLIGRVLDGLGRPIDTLGDIRFSEYRSTRADAINPLKRKRISEPLSLGIKSVDGFSTVGKGQRMGIFAGSGVGKSTTLGMMAKNTSADLNVIALIGERGREVKEFIEEILGTEGMKRSIVIAATSEQPSLVKIKAAFVATTIAEYFRDKGMDVLFMLDSVTRIAMAQREVGLAIGEPPATRGYTPSVFAMMPKLMERAGTTEKGTITGLYTVLVEGDDFNEPISDTARSILDGHIVLSRALAHKNHYPAIDVLQSLSRVMGDVTADEHRKAAGAVRNLLAVHAKNEDLINIGAYVNGSDPVCDKAIALMDNINGFLKQSTKEKIEYDNTVSSIIELGRLSGLS